MLKAKRLESPIIKQNFWSKKAKGHKQDSQNGTVTYV
jgi:hypothetical protein